MARLRHQKKEEKLTDKPESLMALLKAGGQFVLIVFGIIGIAVMVFSDQGLLITLFKKLTQVDSFGSLVIVPIVLFALYLVRMWFERTFGKSSAAAMGTAVMYVMMALGAFFLFRFLTTGSFTG